MARHRNVQWEIPDPVRSMDDAILCALMDIRDELQQLNNLLGCQNFIDIPNRLTAIVRNTTKRKRAAKP